MKTIDNTIIYYNIEQVLKDSSSVFQTDTLVYHSLQVQNYNITTTKMVVFFLCFIITIFIVYWLQKCRYIKQKNEAEKAAKEQVSQLRSQQRVLSQHIIESSRICLKIKEMLKSSQVQISTKELLEPNDWNEISNVIEKYSPDFCLRLKSSYPNLKEEDIHFCCLVKLGFKYAEIAFLLGRTVNMMYKRRNIIIKRMNINGLNHSFEQFIDRF